MRATALERRHPLIVAQKRAIAKRMLQDERYREGNCTECGYKLDDFDLAEGFSKCGQCEGGGRR